MNLGIVLLVVMSGSLDFSVDWSAFKAGADSSRVEFFYAIPYDELLYTQADNELVALFSVRSELTGLTNAFHEAGTLTKRARIRSYHEAQQAQRSFVDGFSITVPAGAYSFRITVAESSSAGHTTGTREETLRLNGFRTGLSLSSLQIGSTVLTDTATGQVSVIPNPARRFPLLDTSVLYVYYEGYNLSPAGAAYQVRAAITRAHDGRPDTVVRTPTLTKEKHGASVAYALGITLAGLGAGAYTLHLELIDVAGGESVSTVRDFTIGAATTETVGSGWSPARLSPLERKYFDRIEHLATTNQLAYYRALSDSGKSAYLAKFWSARNLAEFSRRMETAESRFRQPKTPGANTDRGRVYVKYGEPDAIEQKVAEAEARPREYWHYYGTGYAFVFVDIRGDANYRLVWTNAKEEPKTGLELYLTEGEREQFK